MGDVGGIQDGSRAEEKKEAIGPVTESSGIGTQWKVLERFPLAMVVIRNGRACAW